MFFVVSKILVFLLYPFTWIMLFFILGYTVSSPRSKKRFNWVGIVLLIVFTNQWLIDQVAKKWDYPPVDIPVGKKYSCAIVLGGFNAADAHNYGYFTSAADRFIQGVKLYKMGVVSHLVITGGSAKLTKDDFQYSDWISGELKSLGIPDTAILVDNLSRNTLENGEFTKKLIAKRSLKPPYVLVTSAFHMRRSVSAFQKQGTPVIPFPCNYLAGRGKNDISDFIPQSGPLDTWQVYIKEMVGTLVYRIK